MSATGSSNATPSSPGSAKKAKVSRFRWTHRQVEQLLHFLKDYKYEMDVRGASIDSNRAGQYEFLRSRMAKLYSREPDLFGPEGRFELPATRSIASYSAEELAVATDMAKLEALLIKRGYSRIREKVKEIRQAYAAAVHDRSTVRNRIILEPDFVTILNQVYGNPSACLPEDNWAQQWSAMHGNVEESEIPDDEDRAIKVQIIYPPSLHPAHRMPDQPNVVHVNGPTAASNPAFHAQSPPSAQQPDKADQHHVANLQITERETVDAISTTVPYMDNSGRSCPVATGGETTQTSQMPGMQQRSGKVSPVLQAKSLTPPRMSGGSHIAGSEARVVADTLWGSIGAVLKSAEALSSGIEVSVDLAGRLLTLSQSQSRDAGRLHTGLPAKMHESLYNGLSIARTAMAGLTEHLQRLQDSGAGTTLSRNGDDGCGNGGYVNDDEVVGSTVEQSRQGMKRKHRGFNCNRDSHHDDHSL